MHPLHYAALSHSYQLLRAMLVEGANPDETAPDAGGASVLHFILTIREPTVGFHDTALRSHPCPFRARSFVLPYE
jgi:hypothetical protein